MKKLLFLMFAITTLIFSQIETSFEGIDFNGEKPPDPVIAVGNAHIMLVVNREYSIYDKTNHNLVKTESLANFFSTLSPQPGSILDPKIVYDHYSNRFILLAIDGNNIKRYLLAASTSNDPTGSWYKYSIVGTQYDLDYPGLGYDENSIILTSQSRAGTSSEYSDLTILKKQEIYSNNKNYQKDIKDITNGSKLKPARVIGTNPNEFYLVNTDGPNKIRIWSIANPLGGNPSISVKKNISLGSGYQLS